MAYNLIRLLMAESAIRSDILPRELSFKHTLQIWLTWHRQALITSDSENAAVMFMLIASQQVGNRPGRIEPRAIKRRPKPLPLLMEVREKARENIRKHGHPKKLRA